MKLFRTHTWKRLIAVVLSAVLALSLLTACDPEDVQEIIDILNEYASTTTTFTPRTTPPTSDDTYYGSRATEANCVVYARNRAHEILKDTSHSLTGNAKTWWNYKDDFAGYSEDVNSPKLGAIMVWGNSADCATYGGLGHVAIVEEIQYNDDGSVQRVIVSESSSGGIWYRNKAQKTYVSGYGYTNWYGNATKYWGSIGMTPTEIQGNTQKMNDGNSHKMGFIGYIYLL